MIVWRTVLRRRQDRGRIKKPNDDVVLAADQGRVVPMSILEDKMHHLMLPHWCNRVCLLYPCVINWMWAVLGMQALPLSQAALLWPRTVILRRVN